MNKPLRLADFTRLPPTWRVQLHDGLTAALDVVADAGPVERRFLRYQWYAAALATYGGTARTLVVAGDAAAPIALPLVATGPRWLGAAAVPGCYWPFRSFPVASDDPAAWDALVDALAGSVNVLRVGPVYDGDAALVPLLAAAARRGWAALPRQVAQSVVLDLPTDAWPRASTLKKNRFHEKHLAHHGALTWQFIADWDEAAFAALAQVEAASWLSARTDGSDAKFTATGHGAFWRAAAGDPVLAGMMHAAVLRVDGRPVAFSFDINAGATKYAVANSYDPAFAKHSPGKVLYYRNLIAARTRGIATVDWGAGDSGYKQAIGAIPGPAIRDWLFVRPGVPAAIGRLAARWWTRSG